MRKLKQLNLAILSLMTSAFLFSCSVPVGENNSNPEPQTTLSDTAQVGGDASEASRAAALGKGTITTIADGYDVHRVNLWSSTDGNRTMTGFLTMGEKVNILGDDDPYFYVESANGDGREGYCMKGFVIEEK